MYVTCINERCMLCKPNEISSTFRGSMVVAMRMPVCFASCERSFEPTQVQSPRTTTNLCTVCDPLSRSASSSHSHILPTVRMSGSVTPRVSFTPILADLKAVKLKHSVSSRSTLLEEKVLIYIVDTNRQELYEDAPWSSFDLNENQTVQIVTFAIYSHN